MFIGQRLRWWCGRPLIRRALAITGVAALLALFGWFWWLGVPVLYRSAGGGPDVENVRLNAVTTTRAALLAGFVGLGALGTFWLNSRVYRITARTFEVTERGQLTDRYSKAIEQLGSKTIDVRLGGIYALEQIATDSPRTRDQATIVEVLSAFVRVHSDPIYQYKAARLNAADTGEPSDDEIPTLAAAYVAKRTKPPVDVQAAVTVLGRLPPLKGIARGDLTGAWLAHISIDGASLAGVQLREANLTSARLGHADLTEAQLGHADLTDATLIEARLDGAQLREADLTRAKLFGATLVGARLHQVNLTRALLHKANLTRAQLNKADLTEAQLSHADLTGAQLSKATLFGAQLDGVNLAGARLRGANLARTELGGANLTGARLGGANLVGARLGGANLAHAELGGVDLAGAIGLDQEQVDAALGDQRTKLPAALRAPESWLGDKAPQP